METVCSARLELRSSGRGLPPKEAIINSFARLFRRALRNDFAQRSSAIATSLEVKFTFFSHSTHMNSSISLRVFFAWLLFFTALRAGDDDGNFF